MASKDDCYAIMTKKLTKKGKGKAKKSPPFSLLFLMILFFMSYAHAGYYIIDYDNFDYVNKTGANLTPYGWINYSGGSVRDLSYVYIWPSEEAVICADEVKGYNRRNSTYIATINGSTDGIPLNRTYRYRIRSNTLSDYTDVHFLQIMPMDERSTPTGFIKPALWYYPNISGSSVFAFYTNQSVVSSWVSNLSFPYDDAYHEVQVDYFFTNYPPPTASGYKQVYFMSVYVDGIPMGVNIPVTMATYGMIPEILNGTYFDTRNVNKCMILDYILIFDYEAGTAPLNANDTIPDYLLATENMMPTFTIKKTDKSGYETNTIALSTAMCSPYSLVLTNGTALPTECNPLYITFPILWDYENDSIRYALDCDYSSLYNYVGDSFSKSDREINLLYNSYCDWIPIAYTRPDGATTTTGVRFEEGMNCTEAYLQSPFSNDRSTPHFLYNTESISMNWDLTFTTDIWTIYQFLDFNYDTPLRISTMYESATGYTYLAVNGVIIKYYTTFDNTSITNMRSYIDKSDKTISIRIEQNGIVSYTGKVPFTWNYPLIMLSIGAKATDTSIMTGYLKQGQLFGNFSIIGAKDQVFKDYTTASSLNCSSMDYDSFQGYVFITDDEHGDNYLNYENFMWQTDPNLNDALQNSTNSVVVTDTFNKLFMDSPFLKYLFALILFLGITFGSFASSAYLGNAFAGGIIAVFAGSATIFFLVLFTILPVWFGVVVFLIMALILAGMIRSIFLPSNEG